MVMESFDFEEELKKILESCVDKMLKNDHYLLENKTHECSISSKIGHYLQNELDALKESDKSNIPKELVVDAEYNKCLGSQKTYINRSGEKSKMRPDLIVHIRGENGGEKNFMAIEIKKSINGLCEIEKDYTKLEYLTSGENEFQYQIGAHVVIDLSKKSREICWFKNGNQIISRFL